MMMTTAASIALIMTSASAATQADTTPESKELAVEALEKGRAAQAIVALEQRVEKSPEDPALLINLGIAYAQAGVTNAARAMFERAAASKDRVELETAEGRFTDSRLLARRALGMLKRGEFAPVEPSAATLTRRD